MFRLRGHHLLCLLGYRGMGYSAQYVANMTQIHQTLRADPETKVRLVAGPDDLCVKFPESQVCHCEDTHIYERDAAILEKLNLEIGQTLPWTDIEDLIKQNVVSGDILNLCSTCSWRSYGVCEEGIDEMKAGKGLRVVERN